MNTADIDTIKTVYPAVKNISAFGLSTKQALPLSAREVGLGAIGEKTAIYG